MYNSLAYMEMYVKHANVHHMYNVHMLYIDNMEIYIFNIFIKNASKYTSLRYINRLSACKIAYIASCLSKLKMKISKLKISHQCL